MPLTWKRLLNPNRRKAVARNDEKPSGRKVKRAGAGETRTEIERDFDRILFSTPVRRLADKTQVFPLEKNDSVRSRLTHSHEVANLSRSIGTALAFEYGIGRDAPQFQRNIPAICAAAGLVHDLGNPPFGHQGEKAIQSWFDDYEEEVLSDLDHPQHVKDFLEFEGNAQAFRLVTKLQLLNNNFGLDLTYATLAAMMKYPTASHGVDKKTVSTKKHGYFASEEEIANEVRRACGLEGHVRHPLAFVMEACDDIAYVVLDAEDTIKKGLASISDLHAFLRHHGKGDGMVKSALTLSEQKHKDHRAARYGLSPAELNDVSMQRFRAESIRLMITSVTTTFAQREKDFLAGAVTRSLIEESEASVFRNTLKEFSLQHAYKHKSVLRMELLGHNVIRGLMDMLWTGITDRSTKEDLSSIRNRPFTRYVYSRISENYKRTFESEVTASGLPIRYRECLLLTDMVSGMTDSYALDLYEELRGVLGDFDPKKCIRGATT